MSFRYVQTLIQWQRRSGGGGGGVWGAPPPPSLVAFLFNQKVTFLQFAVSNIPTTTPPFLRRKRHKLGSQSPSLKCFWIAFKKNWISGKRNIYIYILFIKLNDTNRKLKHALFTENLSRLLTYKIEFFPRIKYIKIYL